MFKLLKTDTHSRARLGALMTAHGMVETPVFMPVGTRATVKTLDNADLQNIGARTILGNTYHLNLRPGMDVVRAAGGLHSFMNWDGPILTDSGGFQIFSLSKIAKIREDGVEFKSHIDGKKLFLGPEESMEIQRHLASDIAMVFDDCPPYGASKKDVSSAIDRTHRWAVKCFNQPRSDSQLVFGIIQGGCYEDLRKQSAAEITGIEFDGYAIGGLSVGEPEPEMLRIAEYTAPMIPANKPRYAMGLGTPAQLVELVARGVDMFDCVLPTRVARNGTAYTFTGAFSLKSSQFKNDFQPIDEQCDCFACVQHSRSYIRHLLNVDEILGLRLLTIHNLRTYMRLMQDIRGHIANGTFDSFREEFKTNYRPTNRVAEQRKTG